MCLFVAASILFPLTPLRWPRWLQLFVVGIFLVDAAFSVENLRP
jgi:hypothetical protein